MWNIFNNRWIQLIIIIVIIFGLLIMVGIDFTVQVGASGMHFNVDRVGH